MKINIITGMILAALSPLLFAGTVADAFAGPLPSTGGHPLDSSLSNAQGEFTSSAPARPHDAPDVRHPSTWWDEDVWADPDRPFLYYGDNEVPDMRPGSTVEPPEPQSVVKPDEKPFDPEDFTAFKTVEDLRAERERRLNTAIMNPSPANMQSYQAINAHLLALSARFAQAWQLGRMQNPGYDWTTTAPSANFATVELGAMKRDKSHALVKSLQGDAGLLFIGKKGDPLTQVAAGPVRAFANTWGLELLAVADGIDAPAAGTSIPGFEGFALVQPDAGRAKKLGVNTLPAVILVPNPKAMSRPDFALLHGGLAGRDGMLIAAGAVSGEELSRRLVFILSNPSGFEDTPHIRGRAAPTGSLLLPPDPALRMPPAQTADTPPVVIPHAGAALNTQPVR